MKKVLSLVLAMCMVASCSGCVSQEQYNSALEDVASLTSEVASLEKLVSSLEDDLQSDTSESSSTGVTLEGTIEDEFNGVTYEVPKTWGRERPDDGESFIYWPPTSQTTMIIINVKSVDTSTSDFDFSTEFAQNIFATNIAVNSEIFKETGREEFDFSGQVGFRVEFVDEISGQELNGIMCVTTIPGKMISVGGYYSPDLLATESLEFVSEYNKLIDSVDLGVEGSTSVGETSSTAPSVSSTSPESTPAEESRTSEQAAALSKARDYLDFTAFSHSGLIDQLEYEGFTTEDATWAADNCGADWNQQALQSAKDYLDFTAFSYSGLIDQLEYEGFTTEQATYGVDNCGADWMEQASLCAQNYLDFSDFTRQGLIDQLLYEGFTQEQAEYGVTQVGM